MIIRFILTKNYISCHLKSIKGHNFMHKIAQTLTPSCLKYSIRYTINIHCLSLFTDIKITESITRRA